ncbi:MAG: hypothetical protein PHV57_08350, partial [Methanomicrobiaceae archaeon]|nr:hypothetical protein [Methanomicrobiaceae archaeon]
DAPFYPDTRLASPIVDFCRIQSATMPYHRVARVLEAMGIVIDRGTVRNYAALDVGDIPYTELFGIRMPLSLLNLSVSAVSRGKGGTIEGAEALAACGFPSARRAASGSRPPSKERDQRNKVKEKDERNIQQQH